MLIYKLRFFKFPAILFLLFICVCSCNTKQSVDHFIETIDIDVQSNETICVDSIIKEVHIIPLENNNDCLIGHVDKIKVYNDNLYVLDRKSGKIFIYDKSGKFISRIDHRGRGPKEYLMISDFDIEPGSGNVFVLDGLTDKILIYNEEGFINSHKLGYGAKVISMCFLDRDNIIFETQMATRDDTWKYRILHTNSKFQILKKELPYQKESSLVLGAVSPFIRSGSNVSYLPIYSDCIYQIDSVCMKPYFRIEFGENAMNLDLLYDKKLNPTTLFQGLSKSNSIYFLNVIESTEQVFIYFTYKGKKHAYLYDKSIKDGKFISNFIEGYCGINGVPIISEKDCFIGIINPSEFSNVEISKVYTQPEQTNSLRFEDNFILYYIKFNKPI